MDKSRHIDENALLTPLLFFFIFASVYFGSSLLLIKPSDRPISICTQSDIYEPFTRLTFSALSHVK